MTESKPTHFDIFDVSGRPQDRPVLQQENVPADEVANCIGHLLRDKPTGSYAFRHVTDELRVILCQNDRVLQTVFTITASGRLFGTTVTGKTREYCDQEDLLSRHPEWTKMLYLAVPVHGKKE